MALCALPMGSQLLPLQGHRKLFWLQMQGFQNMPHHSQSMKLGKCFVGWKILFFCVSRCASLPTKPQCSPHFPMIICLYSRADSLTALLLALSLTSLIQVYTPTQCSPPVLIGYSGHWSHNESLFLFDRHSVQLVAQKNLKKKSIAFIIFKSINCAQLLCCALGGCLPCLPLVLPLLHTRKHGCLIPDTSLWGQLIGIDSEREIFSWGRHHSSSHL